MAKRSLFFRNYLAHALLILLALSLSCTAFIYQVNRYALTEKQSQLKSTALSVAEQAAVLNDADSAALQAIFMLGVKQTAKENHMTILVTDPYGRILVWADENGIAACSDVRVNSFAAQRVRRGGFYSEFGTLDVLETASYTVGTQCINDRGDVSALVFAATASEAVTRVIERISRTFLMVVLFTMFGLLFVTYFISMRMTRP